MGVSTLRNDRIAGNGDGSVVVACGMTADDLAFEDLGFENAGTTYVSADGGLGLLYVGDTSRTFNRFRVERCRFATNNRTAITFSARVNDYRVEDCLIEGSAETGIYLAGIATRGIVRHNVIRVPSTVTPVTGSVGISIRQCTDLLCEGNYVENYQLYGILVRDDVNVRVQIVANKVFNGPTNSAGISVNRGDDILISNNQVESYPFGITVFPAAASKDITVVGNQVRSSSVLGIQVGGTTAQPTNVDVRANQLAECAQGIKVEDITAGPVVVDGNSVYRSSNTTNYGLLTSSNTAGAVTWGRNRVTRYRLTDMAALGPDQTIALTYGSTVNSIADIGRRFTLSVTDGGAFTIANPSGALQGQTITYDILNSSGGAMGPPTWGTAFKLAGDFTNPANGKRRTITFYYDGSSWVEVSRAAADI